MRLPMANTSIVLAVIRHIYFGARKLIWNAVVMVVHLDVIVRRDATDAPFGKDIWF